MERWGDDYHQKSFLRECYERIRATDTQAKKALVDEMIAHLDTLTQKITTGQESVITDLTAGWDTRTVAALVMHNAPHRKIYALTHGGNSSLEYRTARWFADHYHIEHLQSLPSVSSPERVQHQLSAHAFYTNGQGSCFRIFSTGSVKTNAIIPHFTGHDAGYHKGLYYPNKFVTDPGAGERLVPENILMRGVFVGIAFHPVTALEHDLKQVLKGIIGECRELSPNTHDILDLFSIYERIGRYSPIDTSLKFPTANNRYCVFESPELIRIASRMPAPIAQNTILLREVLKRYATRSLYRLINNKIFAPALFNRHVARLMKMALEARARTLAALKIPAPSAGELKAQTEITQLLHRTAMEVAASAEQLIPVADNGQSIQTSLLPLPAHIKRKFFYGHVITFTRWHEQILEARRIGLR